MPDLFDITSSGDIIFNTDKVCLRRFSYSQGLQIINYYNKDDLIAHHLVISKDMFYDMPLIFKASELTDKLLKFREHTIFMCATNKPPEQEVEIPFNASKTYLVRVLSKLPFGIGLGSTRKESQDSAGQEEFLKQMKRIIYKT